MIRKRQIIIVWQGLDLVLFTLPQNDSTFF